jgi:protein-S-isoprenylcysteine O-methyltransferase Ste14
MSEGAASASTRAGVRARFAQIAFVFALQGLILFAGAGDLWWVWAWVYLGICTAGLAVNATILLRRSPELVAERGRPGGMRGWDIALSSSWSVASYIALPLVAGLDARWGWTSGMGVGWQLAGAAVLAAGLTLPGWAMAANTWFSTVVRIQSDRGHEVCRSGPYRFVRHPGYLAFTLQTFATSIVLGSLWALLPAALAGALITVRTALEDRTLQAELAGYREYAADVRWRLVPGVW